MKSILKSILKKQSLVIFSIIFLVAINVYLLTFPSKILGKIVDFLYDINENKVIIIQNIKLLLLVSILLLLIRVIWKYLLAYTTRFLEKKYIYLYEIVKSE